MRQSTLQILGISCLAGSLLVLAACAAPAPRRVPPRVAVAPPAAPAPEPARLQPVYFYPAAGQSEAQQDRDRYECYGWAVKQTGFDPARQVPQQERVQVVPSAAPGTGAIAGAATGAIVGAAVSRPGNVGGGAIIGAVAGGLLGAASDSAREQEAQRIEDNLNARAQRGGDGRYDRNATEYRRAMSACLEGRGYTVK